MNINRSFKVCCALLFLSILASCKKESENLGKNTQIVRLSDADAYAITPDGRIWFMLLDKAYLVKMDSLHTYGDASKMEQEERERIDKQNQYNLYHQYQPPNTSSLDTNNERPGGLAALMEFAAEQDSLKKKGSRKVLHRK